VKRHNKGRVVGTASRDEIDGDNSDTVLKVVDNYFTTAQLQTTSKKLKQ
jgi:hypothetical protein